MLALDCQACALGFNPRWGQTLQFQLRVPELALVRFVVEDYDATSPNDFVGQFTLPLSSLKQGWWGRKGWGVPASKTLFTGATHFLREPALSQATPRVGCGLYPTCLAMRGSGQRS